MSPLLSNIYLDPLDQAMAAAVIERVRYADDFVILSRSPREDEYALEQVRQWTVQAGLALHPVKTRRTYGHSLKVIVEDLNRTLKGWFGYFKTRRTYDLSH